MNCKIVPIALALPRTLAGFKGPITKGREERKGEEIGEKEERRVGREERKREGSGEECSPPLPFQIPGSATEVAEQSM